MTLETVRIWTTETFFRRRKVGFSRLSEAASITLTFGSRLIHAQPGLRPLELEL